LEIRDLTKGPELAEKKAQWNNPMEAFGRNQVISLVASGHRGDAAHGFRKIFASCAEVAD
jgi:hypothetical protein